MNTEANGTLTTTTGRGLAVRPAYEDPLPETILKVISTGNLSSLTDPQKHHYYMSVCQEYGLDPKTQPFDWIEDRGVVKLYANKTCAAQLRNMHRISSRIIDEGPKGDIYVVRVQVEDDEGKVAEDIGAVDISNLSGNKLANAMKKAVTQAVRRATLSIRGLGFLDETEVSDLTPFDGDRVKGGKRPKEPSPELQEAFDRYAPLIHERYPDFESHTGEQLAMQKARALRNQGETINALTPEIVHSWCDQLEAESSGTPATEIDDIEAAVNEAIPPKGTS